MIVMLLYDMHGLSFKIHDVHARVVLLDRDRIFDGYLICMYCNYMTRV